LKDLPSSIGQLNALQKPDLNGCSKLNELPSCIGAIEYTPSAPFVMLFQVEKITFMYWPIECTSKV
jgi:hypothetical protein